MGKHPQSNAVLSKRLRRVARSLDAHAAGEHEVPGRMEAYRAMANTCLQAAGRLDDDRRAVDALADLIRVIEVDGLMPDSVSYLREAKAAIRWREE